MHKITASLIAAAACIVSSSASASVVNAGFENGLNGWTTSGNVVADNVNAHDGSFSALLTAEVPFNLPQPTTLSQVFSLNAGENVTFYALFTGLRQGGGSGLDTADISIDISGQYDNVLASWVLPHDIGVGTWQTI